MRIELPWLPKGYNPNGSQANYRGKARAAKKYKQDCAWACMSQRVTRIYADSVDVTVTFHPPSLRRYDLDNALARCKQGLDAVAEAIGVDDDMWLSVRLVRGDKIKGGLIVVEVT